MTKITIEGGEVSITDNEAIGLYLTLDQHFIGTPSGDILICDFNLNIVKPDNIFQEMGLFHAIIMNHMTEELIISI